MKNIPTGEGYMRFARREVVIFCANYIHWGVLETVDVEGGVMVIENPHIVYETGEWSGDLKDAQATGSPIALISLGAIERVDLKDGTAEMRERGKR